MQKFVTLELDKMRGKRDKQNGQNEEGKETEAETEAAAVWPHK